MQSLVISCQVNHYPLLTQHYYISVYEPMEMSKIPNKILRFHFSCEKQFSENSPRKEFFCNFLTPAAHKRACWHDVAFMHVHVHTQTQKGVNNISAQWPSTGIRPQPSKHTTRKGKAERQQPSHCFSIFPIWKTKVFYYLADRFASLRPCMNPRNKHCQTRQALETNSPG